jgi:FAD/FMN-containing dehydrogenase
VLIDPRHLNHVRVERDGQELSANIGAGCQIKRVLRELKRQARGTLPSIGLITEQTIAGATATGTHGSGKHSLSHYIKEVRLATYDPATGQPIIRVVRDGRELLAARCSLGCMGVILSVTVQCRPSYMVEEHVRKYSTLDDVLATEPEYLLQQFFLIPWSWRFMGQHRREVESRRSWLAPVYRAYWFVAVDLCLHLWILLIARWLRSNRIIRFFFRWILPQTVVYGWHIVDHSYAQLTMEHELFRHIEIEMFVNRVKLSDATSFVREVLQCFDSPTASLSDRWREELARVGLLEMLQSSAGAYTHHYPICFRRVLPDDTLISMASGEGEPWYAMSFISYARPADRAGFLAFARFLAVSMMKLFGARPHWGKVIPVDPESLDTVYPRLKEFRDICAAFDPGRVFANRWASELVGMQSGVRSSKRESGVGSRQSGE